MRKEAWNAICDFQAGSYQGQSGKTLLRSSGVSTYGLKHLREFEDMVFDHGILKGQKSPFPVIHQVRNCAHNRAIHIDSASQRLIFTRSWPAHASSPIVTMNPFHLLLRTNLRRKAILRTHHSSSETTKLLSKHGLHWLVDYFSRPLPTRLKKKLKMRLCSISCPRSMQSHQPKSCYDFRFRRYASY